MDKIKIEGLEVFAHHGVFPEETKLGQKFVVNVTLYTNTQEAGEDDDLLKSIHYGEVSHYITQFMKDHTYKLLEAVAENLATRLLLDTKRLERVFVEIRKPWAPIGLPLESVSVAIERGWHTAYIGMGSNIGGREDYLNFGITQINNIDGCMVTKISDFIETKPYGVLDQDDFLNGCLELRTIFSPEQLLKKLNKIEKAANRERSLRWGPRTLDLDILFYDQRILDSEHLIIPHKDMSNRSFVLIPLAQIAGHVRHPILQKTVWEMVKHLDK